MKTKYPKMPQAKESAFQDMGDEYDETMDFYAAEDAYPDDDSFLYDDEDDYDDEDGFYDDDYDYYSGFGCDYEDY